MEQIHRPDEIDWISDDRIQPTEWLRRTINNPHLKVLMDASLGKQAKDQKNKPKALTSFVLAEFFGDDNNSVEPTERIKKLVDSTNPKKAQSHDLIYTFNSLDAQSNKHLYIRDISHATTKPSNGSDRSKPRNPVKPDEPNDKAIESDENVVNQLKISLTVEVYSPLTGGRSKLLQMTRVPCPDQIFRLSDEHHLTDLRDAISCVSDLVPIGEFSQRPREAQAFLEGSAGIDSGSAFFYINGTFYNDLRRETCIDISRPIIEWSKRRGEGVGPFLSSPMSNVKMKDLELRLGYPYVMVHQGNCEHLLVFSDLFLSSAREPTSDEAPLLIGTHCRVAQHCAACRTVLARWVVYDFVKLPKSPTRLCEACFFAYCYDANDKPIGRFRAYPYLDQAAIR